MVIPSTSKANALNDFAIPLDHRKPGGKTPSPLPLTSLNTREFAIKNKFRSVLLKSYLKTLKEINNLCSARTSTPKIRPVNATFTAISHYHFLFLAR